MAASTPLSRWLSVFADEPAKRRRWAHRVAWARRLYPRADAIVAVSNGVADDLAQTLGLARTRITTIYNPVDTAALRQRAAEPVEHPWFAATEPPVILAVGRLVREKNFGALIEAFAALLQRHDSDARLVIVGEGEERGALQARIGVLGLTDRIHLAGWRDNPYALMSASAMLVVSSLFEGLGMVLIEAMACSCAVVSVDCPSGPAEILADGCYGQLVPMHDINTLAEAMHQTLTTPPDKPVLIERAEAFSVAAAYAGYNRLIAEVTTGVYN